MPYFLHASPFLSLSIYRSGPSISICLLHNQPFSFISSLKPHLLFGVPSFPPLSFSMSSFRSFFFRLSLYGLFIQTFFLHNLFLYVSLCTSLQHTLPPSFPPCLISSLSSLLSFLLLTATPFFFGGWWQGREGVCREMVQRRSLVTQGRRWRENKKEGIK